MTPYRVYETMLAHPYPGLAGLTRDGDDCVFVLDGAPWRYNGAQWTVGDRKIPAEWPKFGNLDDADKVHWQIRGVLEEFAKPSDRTNAETVDAPLVIGGGATVDILRTAIESIAEHVGAEPWALDEVKGKVASMQDRLTDEIDRRKDVEAQLAKMTDAHAVVSQRLVGAQKEVAERDATIDELRTALESIAANVGLVGSDQWAVGELVGKVGEATARADKIEDRLRRDDDLCSAIAVAVGLDGSASLALILDTVTRDRPGREISRLSGLLDVLAAPVAFGERRLSTAERAEWALRRWLAEGKECSARMAQLIEAEVLLDCMGVPAYATVPSDDPGDASEALTVAERLRLHFGARS